MPLFVGYTAPPVRLLEPAILGHVTNTSAREATRLLSIGFVLPLALVAFTFLRQGIDLNVVWSSPVIRRHCHACLVAGTEESRLSSLQRYPGFASGVGVAPLKVLCQEESFLHVEKETAFRNRFPIENVLLPFVKCCLKVCEH